MMQTRALASRARVRSTLRPTNTRFAVVRRSFQSQINSKRPLSALGLARRDRPASRVATTVAPSLESRRTMAAYAPKRDQSFAKIEESDLTRFRAIVGEENVRTNATEIEPYSVDWLGRFGGSPPVVLLPRTTEEVSQILRHCNERRLAVVPQSGNTGLVGGSVPVFDEIVVNLKRMNTILSVDSASGVAVVESGVVLQQLDDHLRAEHDAIVPLDLGAKGSCMIGGNVSTNAGGLRLVRYGSLHGSVMGLEVVLADGTVLENLNTLRKDNTGYDLKQLFIGGEGTLGIVTKVSILTAAKPKSVNVAYLGLESFDKVQVTLRRAKAELGEILSAIEFQDRPSLESVVAQLEGARDPLEGKHNFYVLIETSGSNAAHDQEKINGLLEGLMEDGVVEDGTFAQDSKQFGELWQLREGVAESLTRQGLVFKYDVSIHLPRLYALVEEMRERVGDRGVTVGYGHVGDSNLHLNILSTERDESLADLIEPFVYEWVSRENGSVSAEHGVGLQKPTHLHYSKSTTMIEYMQKVKDMFDPNGILNPYKVLPPRT